MERGCEALDLVGGSHVAKSKQLLGICLRVIAVNAIP
jgi:hypothetical protein